MRYNLDVSLVFSRLACLVRAMASRQFVDGTGARAGDGDIPTSAAYTDSLAVGDGDNSPTVLVLVCFMQTPGATRHRKEEARNSKFVPFPFPPRFWSAMSLWVLFLTQDCAVTILS